MKIKAKAGTKAMGAGGHSVEFDEKGFATVEKEVGEALVAAFPRSVEVVEKKATRKSSTEEE
jgi:hypothetical protein